MAQQQQVNIADLDMNALQQVKGQLEEVTNHKNTLFFFFQVNHLIIY